MPWGAKQSDLTLPENPLDTGTGVFWPSIIQLEPGEEAHVQVLVKFSTSTSLGGNQAVEASIMVQAATDDATPDWDDSELFDMGIHYSEAATPGSSSRTVIASFVLAGYRRFRLGVRGVETITGGLGRMIRARLFWRINSVDLSD